MTRGISPAIEAVLSSDRVNVAYLIELGLDSGSVYLWSGEGDLAWDGKLWKGVGALGGISAITEDTELSDVRIKATLSHLPIENMPDFVTEFTSNNPVGRPYTINLVFFNENAQVEDALPLSAGFIDALNMSETGDGISESAGGIELILASEAALLSRNKVLRLTHQHQQMLFPGDMGMEFVTDSNLAEIRWGQAEPKTVHSFPTEAPNENLLHRPNK